MKINAFITEENRLFASFVLKTYSNNSVRATSQNHIVIIPFVNLILIEYSLKNLHNLGLNLKKTRYTCDI
jgi:hypothetical protein